MEHKDWKLCHGHLVSYDKNGNMVKRSYAWCEKGKRYFDPKSGLILAKNLQLGIEKRSAAAKFTYTKARKFMSMHHRYSRWNELWDYGFWRYV